MSTEVKNIRLTHERDAAWLIALYLAVHGGDPAPKEGTVVAHDQQLGAALAAIAALSEALDEKARDAVRHALAPIQKQFPLKSVDAEVAGARLEEMGIHFTDYAAEPAHGAKVTEELQQLRRPYCIRIRGEIVCVRPHLFA
ncbi:MAG TPA: hypothetical protein VGM86_27700 [Thermoanaerobaculia bacterium]|jgi:hypothetical protein